MLNISFTKQLLIWLTVVVGLTFAMPNGFYGRVETHNDAMALIDTGLSNAELEADAAEWPGFQFLKPEPYVATPSSSETVYKV